MNTQDFVNIDETSYLPYSLDMIENKSHLTIDVMSKNENCMLNALVEALDNKINIKKLKEFLLKNEPLDLKNINTRRRETNEMTKNFLKGNIKVLNKKLQENEHKRQRLEEKYNYYGIEGNSSELIKMNKERFELDTQLAEDESNIMQLNTDLNKLKTIRRRDIFDDNCWFNTELIQILEDYLNIKIIVINKTRWEQEFNTELFFCEKRSLTEGSARSDNAYVVLVYNNNNYDLIRYDNKGVLNYQELPEELKYNCFINNLEGGKRKSRKSRKKSKKSRKSRKSRKFKKSRK